MIHFPCPQCGKMLKVTEESGGKPIPCRRCGELCVAPVAPAPAASGGDERQVRSRAVDADRPRGLFTGMSRRERWAVALVVGAGAIGLLLGVLPVAAVAQWKVPLAVCSAVLLLAILHGHATGCPACGRWWSRGEVAREFVARELSEQDGGPLGKSLCRTTYACENCGHRWVVADTDEYPEPVRNRPKRHLR